MMGIKISTDYYSGGLGEPWRKDIVRNRNQWIIVVYNNERAPRGGDL